MLDDLLCAPGGAAAAQSVGGTKLARVAIFTREGLSIAIMEVFEDGVHRFAVARDNADAINYKAFASVRAAWMPPDMAKETWGGRMSFAPNGFTTAWHNGGEFWTATLSAVARHPLLILVCAAVPAAERAYMLLETRPIPRWRVALLEVVLTVWRILLCIGAVWVAVTPERWHVIRVHFSGNVAAQRAMQQLGAYLGNHLHVVLWELALLAATLLLLNYLLVLAARGLSRAGMLRRKNAQKAFVSVLRNLVLVPLALIYLVEMFQSKVY